MPGTMKGNDKAGLIHSKPVRNWPLLFFVCLAFSGSEAFLECVLLLSMLLPYHPGQITFSV